MRHNPEDIPNNPELPMDNAIVQLMTEAGISASTRKLVVELLTDNTNIFLEKDKEWVIRQVERIIKASDPELNKSLKSTFLKELSGRKDLYMR